MSNTRKKADPRPILERNKYHARPSTTEPGQWTVMEQIKGETSLRLFVRARDVAAAATILWALNETGSDIERIVPVASVEVGSPGGETVEVDVYGDGSVYLVRSANGVPERRVAKRDLSSYTTPSGWTLDVAVAEVLARAAVAAAEPGS